MGGEETLEIDPEVAMSLGWNDGALVRPLVLYALHPLCNSVSLVRVLINTKVEIGLIHNPTKARSVSVTPVSEDDWEILVSHISCAVAGLC